jgi:hypothetical protein
MNDDWGSLFWLVFWFVLIFKGMDWMAHLTILGGLL